MIERDSIGPVRRSFSPRTVMDILLATVSQEELCKRYDIHPIELRLLLQAEHSIDDYGRISE